jgi:hypothetical protein
MVATHVSTAVAAIPTSPKSIPLSSATSERVAHIVASAVIVDPIPATIALVGLVTGKVGIVIIISHFILFTTVFHNFS